MPFVGGREVFQPKPLADIFGGSDGNRLPCGGGFRERFFESALSYMLLRRRSGFAKLDRLLRLCGRNVAKAPDIVIQWNFGNHGGRRGC